MAAERQQEQPTPPVVKIAEATTRLQNSGGGFFSIVSGVGVSPLYCGHFWPIVPAQMIGDGGMRIGRGNRSTRRKPAPAPLCPPQIPLDQTQDRNRAAAVGSQRLAA
jgi:hypothetical protein